MQTKIYPILFYIGKGIWADRVVRWWTKSMISHTELGRSDGLFHSNDRFHRRSRLTSLTPCANEWIIIELELPVEIMKIVEQEQEKRIGTGYDWLGIICTHGLGISWHSKRRWFCSKSNVHDLVRARELMMLSPQKYRLFIEVLEPFGRIPAHFVTPARLYTMARLAKQRQQRRLCRLSNETLS
ncbi:MAG: hypothetical protein K6347_08635 [Campylobacterales bacterium]